MTDELEILRSRAAELIYTATDGKEGIGSIDAPDISISSISQVLEDAGIKVRGIFSRTFEESSTASRSDISSRNILWLSDTRSEMVSIWRKNRRQIPMKQMKGCVGSMLKLP